MSTPVIDHAFAAIDKCCIEINAVISAMERKTGVDPHRDHKTIVNQDAIIKEQSLRIIQQHATIVELREEIARLKQIRGLK